jgi:hypothetical protein
MHLSQSQRAHNKCFQRTFFSLRLFVVSTTKILHYKIAAETGVIGNINMSDNPQMGALLSHNLNSKNEDRKALAAETAAEETLHHTKLFREANDIAKDALSHAREANKDAISARRRANMANIIAVIAIAITVREDIQKLIMYIVNL